MKQIVEPNLDIMLVLMALGLWVGSFGGVRALSGSPRVTDG